MYSILVDAYTAHVQKYSLPSCGNALMLFLFNEVLDKSRVVKVVARESRRSVWLVQGSRGSPYLCLRQYCSCRYASLFSRSRRGVTSYLLLPFCECTDVNSVSP